MTISLVTIARLWTDASTAMDSLLSEFASQIAGLTPALERYVRSQKRDIHGIIVKKPTLKEIQEIVDRQGWKKLGIGFDRLVSESMELSAPIFEELGLQYAAPSRRAVVASMSFSAGEIEQLRTG